MFKTRIIVITLSSLLLISGWVVLPLFNTAEGESQGSRTQTRTEGGMRQQAGQMDAQVMQKAMLDRMKNDLAATDQEWTTIEPLLKKVMTLSNEINPRGMGMRMMGGRTGRLVDQTEQVAGQPGQPANQADQSEFQKASIALREVIEKAESTPEEISDKLAAFRTAKAAAQKELAAEQNKLKKALNPRQEARLVLMEMLN